MQVIVLLCVLAALIAMNWSFLGLDKAFGRRGAPRGILRFRSCRWKRDPRREDGQLERWVCARCGVDAYTSNGRAPDGCKRHLRDSGL